MRYTVTVLHAESLHAGETDATSPPRFRNSQFQLTANQPLRPDALALAILVCSALVAIGVYASRFQEETHNRTESATVARTAGPTRAGRSQGDNSDDAPGVDTLVFGDPADLPSAHRRATATVTVHPTLVGRLPLFGEGPGLLPDTPGGHTFYRWLVAFNKADSSQIRDLLPEKSLAPTPEAQIELRRKNGGFSLESAKEIRPGVLHFLVKDQTSSGCGDDGLPRSQSCVKPGSYP